MRKVKTGVGGLDEMLKGGIPEGSLVELSGVPGAGKTILALQFALCGAENDEPAVYVSFEQTESDVRNQLKSLGLRMQENLSILFFDSERDIPPNMIASVLERIGAEVKRTSAKRLVVDSITSMISLFLTPSFSTELSAQKGIRLGGTTILPIFVNDEPQIRSIVWDVLKFLRSMKCTTLITSELPQDFPYYSRDTISEFKVDGIILLEKERFEGQTINTIRIAKMRYTEHEAESRQFSISKGGIKIRKWHRVEEK